MRNIAKRIMPGLYEEAEQEKIPPTKSRRRNGASCRDEWLDKSRKEDDDDPTNGGAASQSVYNVHRQSDEEESNADRQVSQTSVDPYSFREERQEEDVTAAQAQWSNTDEEEDTLATEGFSANLGSSVIFGNADLSNSLGPVNNPFRSTGWVKTCCGGGSLSPDSWLPDLPPQDDEDVHPSFSSPPREYGADDVQMTDGRNQFSNLLESDSDMETG